MMTKTEMTLEQCQEIRGGISATGIGAIVGGGVGGIMGGLFGGPIGGVWGAAVGAGSGAGAAKAGDEISKS